MIVRLCLLSILLFVLTAGVWLCLQNEYNLQLSLQGEKEITLEVGETYTDPGAIAQFSGTWVAEEPVQVDASGEVVTTTLGDYVVQYTAKSNGYQQIDYRTVHIVDTTKPVITLVSNPDNYTLPGQPYDEEGFKATDNYDGNITKSVERVEKDGVVTYTVADSSGNTATASRTIILVRNCSNARIMRKRVLRGSITSSM